MWEDPLTRHRRVIWAIEASPNGFTVIEIPQREESGIRRINRNPGALQAAGFPLCTARVDRGNRWAFKDPFKSKILPSFPIVKPFLETP
jgi:hypothetical protein